MYKVKTNNPQRVNIGHSGEEVKHMHKWPSIKAEGLIQL